MNTNKSNFIIMKSYYQLYNKLDGSFKRCIYIDVLSILFIILPKKYFLTKRNAIAWLLIFLFSMITTKGGKPPRLQNSSDYIVSTKNNKYSIM